MSITQDLRTRAKHRGKTRRELVKLVGRLEREADDTTCRMVVMATELDELAADRNSLAARLEEQALAHQAVVDDLIAERDYYAEELAALRLRFAAELAADANANAVTVPPMLRDTSAIEDQATGPINVRALWDARDAGLLGPLRPVLDPGHIH